MSGRIRTLMRSPSSSMRAILALSGSSLFAQVLSFFSAPVLARLYSPADYGTLNALMALASPLVLIAGLQLAPAIVIVPSSRDADALFATAAAIGIIVASVLAMGLFVFRQQASTFLHIGADGPAVLALASIAVAASTLSTAVAALANRHKAYGALASSRLSGNVVGVGTNIALGFLAPGPLGLVTGYVAGVLAQLLHCGVAVRAQIRESVRGYRLSEAPSVIARFKSYPLQVLPSDVLNSFLNQAPVYGLSAMGNAAATGTYGMANRMLGLPSTLLASSIGEVFRREAAEQYASQGECYSLFRRTLKHLLVVAVPSIGLLALVGPGLFALLLGERWRGAGEVVQLLAPVVLMKFVASPLSYLYVIAGRQREDLLLHIFFFTVMVAALGAEVYLDLGATLIIGTFSAVWSSFYLFSLVRSWQFARGSTGGPRSGSEATA